ncbi:helix-turn-helix domain-containing protein [Snodgrassella gandavensis]|uniref:LysR family transcriptional regulator n=1 Tax=Snodgrassella gandavensis TaxID=2946698 RepID=UPI001EF6D278|nr:LysR family transcriptional regulator [Snodgrassella gandavensis]
MNIYSKRLPTIKQLQYFVAVCEESSFRGAAERLGVSQPPLSVQIKDLEEKLEVILFLRNSH